MTADEFWYASPFLTKSYRDAHKLRLRMQNEQAWLQGMYVYSAVRAVVSGALGSRGKDAAYIKSPVDLGLETDAEKADKKRREREKLIATLDAWKKAWDGKKSGEKS